MKVRLGDCVDGACQDYNTIYCVHHKENIKYNNAVLSVGENVSQVYRAKDKLYFLSFKTGERRIGMGGQWP